MVKVCILTSVHSPFDIRIFHKEAKSLARAGYDVTLIAQHDKDEIVDGIRIVPLPRPKDRLERMTKTVWSVYRKALEIDADIYHFHDSELIPIGFLLKFKGKHVIYDIHEDVPKDVQDKLWIPVRIRKIIGKSISLIEAFAAGVLSGLISATPSIASRFPPYKTVVVQNFPILKELNENNVRPYNQRLRNIVYTGNIRELYGPKEMINAIELLPDSLDVKLILAGAFSPSQILEELRQMSGWARVDFLGWISRMAVREVLDNARIGLVLYHPAPNHIESQPNKLFEYMSVGIPVIASDFPLWRQIVEGAGCGLLVDPLDTKAIAGAIQWLLEHPKEAESMGQRGRRAVEKLYNWEREEQKLVSLYNRLLSKQNR